MLFCLLSVSLVFVRKAIAGVHTTLKSGVRFVELFFDW